MVTKKELKEELIAINTGYVTLTGPVTKHGKHLRLANSYFYYCDKQKIPYIKVFLKKKYCLVSVDLITCTEYDWSAQGVNILNELIMDELRAHPKKSSSCGPGLFIYVHNVLIERGIILARKFREICKEPYLIKIPGHHW